MVQKSWQEPPMEMYIKRSCETVYIYIYIKTLVKTVGLKKIQPQLLGPENFFESTLPGCFFEVPARRSISETLRAASAEDLYGGSTGVC